jgi:DNA repair protein RecN (Recombination protein N)
VRFAPAASEAQWTERGIETAEFYISPNPGEDLRPLARIASGGELSRIMLALKTLASTDAPGKTLIFCSGCSFLKQF